MTPLQFANIWIILTMILAFVCLICIFLPPKYFKLLLKLSTTLSLLILCCSGTTWLLSQSIQVTGGFTDLIFKVYTLYILAPITLFLTCRTLLTYYFVHKN